MHHNVVILSETISLTLLGHVLNLQYAGTVYSPKVFQICLEPTLLENLSDDATA